MGIVRVEQILRWTSVYAVLLLEYGSSRGKIGLIDVYPNATYPIALRG